MIYQSKWKHIVFPYYEVFVLKVKIFSLLIDGQNDQIGNWNFTLQKIFHNTYIIRHKISVIINIIGSSYSQPEIFSCPCVQIFFHLSWTSVATFLSQRFRKVKIWDLANSCPKELNTSECSQEQIVETTLMMEDDEWQDDLPGLDWGVVQDSG